MIQGYVKRINTKSGSGKRGGWTLFSGIVEQDNGQESGWVSFGFEKPPFSEGSYVSFETETTDRGIQMVAGSAKILPPPAKPATPEARKASTGQVDRNDSIVYQSSRKDALALVALLLEHDGLPISANTAKAGQAKRFEEVKAFVDKLTVEFFNDVNTLRVLSAVVDAGAVEQEATSQTQGASADND